MSERTSACRKMQITREAEATAKTLRVSCRSSPEPKVRTGPHADWTPEILQRNLQKRGLGKTIECTHQSTLNLTLEELLKKGSTVSTVACHSIKHSSNEFAICTTAAARPRCSKTSVEPVEPGSLPQIAPTERCCVYPCAMMFCYEPQCPQTVTWLYLTPTS